MQHRVNRRRFLQVGSVSAVAAIALPQSFLGQAFAAEAPNAALSETSADATDTAQERMQTWSFDIGMTGPSNWESGVLDAGFVFDSSSARWVADGADVVLEARVLDSAGAWSDWYHLQEDMRDEADAANVAFAGPLLGTGMGLQARVRIGAGVTLEQLQLTAVSVALPADAVQQEAVSLIDGFIVPRAGWQADERWRYVGQDTSKGLAWPPEYQATEKIVIHHSATTNRPPDVGVALRSIYRYHAIERGWGDIGYNFVIDHNGVVYEGRYGGENVIGGHALRYNRGSIGICLLGNFDTGSPTDAALDALLQLIWARAAHIDVTAAEDFQDLLDCPNLVGHGDLMSTSCPGANLDVLLPSIRGWLTGSDPIYLAPPVKPEALEIISLEIGPETVASGNLLQVRAVVRNAGSVTLSTSGPEPGFIYDETQNFEEINEPKLQDAYRICLDFVGNTSIPRPWRWGLGSPLAPGEERVVEGYVRLHEPGVWTYTGSAIKEWVAVIAENGYVATVETARPPVVRTNVWPGGEGRYFSETGHNVPPAFARFWDQYGGLRRFGYPLTEPFNEVSETDGGTWLTQYFERARFEYHPEYAGTVDAVQLGLLGAELARARRNESPFQRVSDPAQDGVLYFPETGHTLRNRFRAAWEARGGLRIFGFPISEPFDELSQTDGKWHTVQYFERNRFEYHPDYAGSDDEIMLGHLGREVLIRRGWIEGV